MSMRNQRYNIGFNLIELMTVVIITTILLTIAISSYIHHANRAQIAEVLANLRILRTDITVFYSTHDRFPLSLAEIGHAATEFSKYIRIIELSNMSGTPFNEKANLSIRLIVKLNPDYFWGMTYSNNQLMLEAAVVNDDDGSIGWICKPRMDASPVAAIDLPPSCRG